MIKLENQQNVLAPNGEYPYGDIIDDDGSGNGTPVDKIIHADYHQFFARMFAISGMVSNGVPDNAYDGFQYFEALQAVILSTGKTAFGDPAYAGTYQADATSPIKIRINNGLVTIKGKVDNSVPTSLIADSLVCNIPLGFSPLEPQFFSCPDTLTPAVGIFSVLPNGELHLRGDLINIYNNSTYINCSYYID